MAGGATAVAERCPHFVLDELGDGVLKMLVHHASSPGAHRRSPGAAMRFDMLEDTKTEPEDAVRRLRRQVAPTGRRRRTQHVVNAAEEQLVLVAEVRVEGRPADVRAVQYLLDHD